MSANPARGEAEICLAGVALRLRPSFSALVAAESEVGPLFALVERAAEGRLTLAEMAGLFWHCLDPKPEALTRDHFSQALRGGAGAVDPRLKGSAGADLTGPMMDMTSRAACLAGLAGAVLGWRPHEFWRATPAELAAVFGAASAEDAAGTATLNALMEQYPDG